MCVTNNRVLLALTRRLFPQSRLESLRMLRQEFSFHPAPLQLLVVLVPRIAEFGT